MFIRRKLPSFDGRKQLGQGHEQERVWRRVEGMLLHVIAREDSGNDVLNRRPGLLNRA